jgi:DNA-binding HxlR family transcriptional regulator
MSEEQKRFDDLMKRVIKVSPEELRRRLAAKKTAKKPFTKTPKTEN